MPVRYQQGMTITASDLVRYSQLQIWCRHSVRAVSLALQMFFCVSAAVAADRVDAAGPRIPQVDSETGPAQRTEDGAGLLQKARQEIKRTLAILSAENGTDPTAIVGQLSPRTRYQSREKDQRVQEIARVSLPLAPDWLLRVDAPFTYLDPKQNNEKSVAGTGDVRARLGWRVLHSADGSLFLGSEFYFPTASQEQLGSGRFSVGPAVVGSVNLPDWRSNAYLWVEYLTSVTGDLRSGSSGSTNASDVSTSESRIRMRLNTLWSEQWWSFVESRFFVDWKQNAKTGMVLLFEGGRRLDNHWRLYVRPEVGLWGRDLPGAFDYGVEAGVRYMFYVF